MLKPSSNKQKSFLCRYRQGVINEIFQHVGTCAGKGTVIEWEKKIHRNKNQRFVARELVKRNRKPEASQQSNREDCEQGNGL